MTDRLDLPPRYLRIVQALLREHVPDAEVWAYGSRVNGSSHEGSDLDLVLRSPTLEPIPGDRLADLAEALEQSNIPILVQPHDWARLPESFHPEIERDYVVAQKGGDKEATGSEGEWREMVLGDVCTKIGSGATPRGGKDVYLEDGPYALIRSQNVYNAGFSHDGLAFISDEQADSLRNVEVFPDDVLLNITGDSVARVCQVDLEVLPARVNQHVAIIRTDPDKLDPRFLRYFLTCPETQTMLLSWAGSGGTRNALTKEMIQSLSVFAPPLPEQRAIAHILGTLDNKIELNRRMNETLEAMARALFKSWFVDFDPVRAKAALITPPRGGSDWSVERARAYLPAARGLAQVGLAGMDDRIVDLFPDRLVDSELGEIPEGWEVKELGELIELAYGKALKADDRKGGSIPVYGSNGQVGWHDKKLVTGPGIVVGRKGNPGVVTWTHSDFFPIDTTFYVVPRAANVELAFLFFALITQDLPSVSADSAVPGLNRNLAYMNRQLVPDKTVVDEFNDNVGAIFSRRHDLEEEARALAAQRDALLPKLVSGELRVTGLGREERHLCP